jgi:DNA-binding transcriptional LysR family regulator
MDAALSGERRTLRLGAVPSALATLVPAAIGALRADEPALDVEAEEGTTPALAEAVRAGRLHAAVAFQDAAGPRREHAGTRRVELGEDPLLALVGAAHRLAGREEIALRELASDPWMVPEPDGLHVAACRSAGFEPRVAILTRDPLAACAFAAAGLAVSLTPRLTPALPGVATPRLSRPPRRAIYALLPATGAHSRTDALITALRAAAQAASG